ncbi:Ubiquitin carboxyl-terminal hydrolase 37 [Liparis tanakae]|uniref:ubiquitinyl hydrolase 1 n=1 Tax=Liparis tanakae TaxID=230148 RepID=A0A4Z2I1F9_9TELE|nr:Ubiquitin carboxyl-terminal hydrolase 37 [Liparis tanakae]
MSGKALLSNVVDVLADESQQTHGSQRSVATSQDEKPTYAEQTKMPEWWSLGKAFKAPHQDQVRSFKGPTEEEEIRQQQIKCLGFPNPTQICYVNACLQSLLTLKDFVRAISCQEYLWNLIPEAALIRSFMAIKRSHLSGNARHKLSLLGAFKSSIWSPEFRDLDQKDAHEFLTSVLEQMRCLSPQLQMMAASMGRTYSCPVEDHVVFKMVNTRTCKGCGVGSTREEQFTNLSLDVIPGCGSVEQMLQDYLMETKLEYNCECGATTSSQRLSFLTLPRVLVLHLKRFKFTPSFELRKVHDPVVILRELVLQSNQEGVCYSLVSSINHIGLTAETGHYICDGVDQNVGEEDPTDRWFTYNDEVVTETSGTSVCDKRKNTSYILSYRRQDLVVGNCGSEDMSTGLAQILLDEAEDNVSADENSRASDSGAAVHSDRSLVVHGPQVADEADQLLGAFGHSVLSDCVFRMSLQEWSKSLVTIRFLGESGGRGSSSTVGGSIGAGGLAQGGTEGTTCAVMGVNGGDRGGGTIGLLFMEMAL